MLSQIKSNLEEEVDFEFVRHPQRDKSPPPPGVSDLGKNTHNGLVEQSQSTPVVVSEFDPNKFSLGTLSSGQPFLVDLPKLLETRLLINASSGGGKSHTLCKILEETHGKVLQVVIDPEGEFAPHVSHLNFTVADRDNAEPGDASKLAHAALKAGKSLIADLYEFEKDDREEFVKNLLEGLINAPKDLWRPCLILIDEAHLFCPDKIQKVASAKAVMDLAARGRKRGFACIVSTQRLAKLHKDVAAECLNKLIGRTTLDRDLVRAGDEIGMRGPKAGSLRRLVPGQFYAYGPALLERPELVKIGRLTPSHERKTPSSNHKMLEVVTEQAEDKERIWKECVELARRLSQGLNRRLQIAELALKCCDIVQGGGGHWSGHQDLFTVKKFAQEIGMNYKTVWNWIGTKRNVIDLLDKGEYREQDWKFAQKAFKDTRSSHSAEQTLAKFRELRDCSKTTYKLGTIIEWARSHQLFIQKGNLSQFNRDDLTKLLSILDETRETLRDHLNKTKPKRQGAVAGGVNAHPR